MTNLHTIADMLAALWPLLALVALTVAYLVRVLVVSNRIADARQAEAQAAIFHQDDCACAPTVERLEREGRAS